MTKRSISKTDYSRIAGYYDRVRPPPADVWIARIIEYGKISETSSVLDIGCGTGRYPLGILSLRRAVITCLEPSTDMLRKAIENDESRGIFWVQGDGQKLPFRSDCFDCVYMTLVIHHIEERELALSEIHRTLKEGGNCVIMTNSHYRMRRGLLRHFPGLVAMDLKRFPTIPQLKGLMTEVGFRNVHHRVVKNDEGFLPTEEYLDRVRRKHISTLTLLDEEEFRRGLKVFEERVRRAYGSRIRRVMAFDFVIGKK